MGISVEEFKHLTPYKLECCLNGYNMSRQVRDREMWQWFGNYALSAIHVAVDHCLNGRKAKSEYIEKPILHHLSENTGLTEEEIYEKKVKKALLAEEQWITASRSKGLPETII